MTGRRVLVIGGLVLVLLPAVLIVAVMQFAASSWETQQRVIAANERAALRDLAAVRAARQAHRRATGGPSAPVLPALPPEKAAGYARRLHLGPLGFAYVAVPLEPGWSGRRAFCVDDSGLIRIAPEGTDPQAADGVCPSSLLILNEAGAF
jgi:hypothetical protein